MNKQVDLTFQVQPGTISWRDSISIHPAADLFPMMTADELKALGEDIKKNGLTSPIAIAVFLDPDHNEPILLDGRNRLDAMEHVGLQVGIVRPMTRKESWSLIAKENQSGNWYQINITKRIGATVTVVTSDPVEYVITSFSRSQGQSRRFGRRPMTSDHPPTTDILRPERLVRFVPSTDIMEEIRPYERGRSNSKIRP